ncbi:SET domain-containing protein-lysine N-methyltransferase [bacterium]|nr:SET domain-containing protein-lysine N-methyltransferase [bacterium]
MFARSDIRKDEVVVIWGGYFTDRKGIEELGKKGEEVMRWDEDLYSYDAGIKEEAYLVNHSCDPTLWMEDAFTLTARRNVHSGEELTIDYGLFQCEDNYISKWHCHCGSPLCRGRVTGQDWKIPALQKLYEGHFSPLLNKRILVLKENHQA